MHPVFTSEFPLLSEVLGHSFIERHSRLAQSCVGQSFYEVLPIFGDMCSHPLSCWLAAHVARETEDPTGLSSSLEALERDLRMLSDHLGRDKLVSAYRDQLRDAEHWVEGLIEVRVARMLFTAGFALDLHVPLPGSGRNYDVQACYGDIQLPMEVKAVHDTFLRYCPEEYQRRVEDALDISADVVIQLRGLPNVARAEEDARIIKEIWTCLQCPPVGPSMNVRGATYRIRNNAVEFPLGSAIHEVHFSEPLVTGRPSIMILSGAFGSMVDIESLDPELAEQMGLRGEEHDTRAARLRHMRMRSVIESAAGQLPPGESGVVFLAGFGNDFHEDVEMALHGDPVTHVYFTDRGAISEDGRLPNGVVNHERYVAIRERVACVASLRFFVDLRRNPSCRIFPVGHSGMEIARCLDSKLAKQSSDSAP